MLVLKQVGELINIDVGLAGSVVVENAKPLKIHIDTMLRTRKITENVLFKPTGKSIIQI